MKKVLTNLSNHLFEQSRFRLNNSARKFGIDGVFSYDFSEIAGTHFYEKHRNILSESKGLGYWLWKPYIILEAFEKISEGDVVIYSDCGIEIVKDLQPLVDICVNETDILLFANGNFTNKIWTKRDCFVLMGCDEKKYWDGIHCDAAFSLFKKTNKSIQFLEEWLAFGANENIITDLPNITGRPNFPEFMDHRRDQSILSLLAIKHGIEFYRMPTQFGNHYKMEAFRVSGEFNCVNQANQNQVDYYANPPFDNSPYFQLLHHHRTKSAKTESLNFTNRMWRIGSNLKRSIKKIIGVAEMPLVVPNTNEKNSYSQCGEDLIVQYICGLRGIEKPSYIDIGANDPFYLSNTALFYKKGCRGINIEANPRLFKNFELHRPDDINLNIGVSDKENELDFYVMSDNTLSTFSKDEADAMIKHGKTLDAVEKVKLTTIDKILETYYNGKFPDFLSIDVEGLDFQILQSIDFEKSFPKIICVEAAEYSPIGAGARRNELIDFLSQKGYYEYANTNLNAIMVKNEFWFI